MNKKVELNTALSRLILCFKYKSNLEGFERHSLCAGTIFTERSYDGVLWKVFPTINDNMHMVYDSVEIVSFEEKVGVE